MAVSATALTGPGAAAAANARALSVEQKPYAAVIAALNEKRAIERMPFGLVTTLRDTAKAIDDYNDVSWGVVGKDGCEAETRQSSSDVSTCCRSKSVSRRRAVTVKWC
jgi:hypothetical protein